MLFQVWRPFEKVSAAATATAKAKATATATATASAASAASFARDHHLLLLGSKV